MNKTNIGWCDFSSNPIYAVDKATGKGGWFCTRVSEGCRNCYASTLNVRRGTGHDYSAANRDKVDWQIDSAELDRILRRRKPARIFLGTMTDIFHEDVPLELLDELLSVIGSAGIAGHTILLLTKRPERMRDYIGGKMDEWSGQLKRLAGFPECFRLRPMDGLWLGVSVENQPTADERIPLLLETPAAVHWVSVEPMLGPVDLTPYIGYNPMYESTKSGERSLQRRQTGPAGDIVGRDDLEGGGTTRQQVESATYAAEGSATPSGAGSGPISTSSAHDGFDPHVLHGPAARMASLPRSDSARLPDQPQERMQEGQQAGEPGNSHAIGESETRLQDGAERRAGPEESERETDRRADRGHQENLRSRRTYSTDARRNVRRDIQDDLEDRAGGASPTPVRPDSGLHRPPSASEPSKGSGWQISWCVIGGESGPNHRPMELSWLESAVAQCDAAGVPVFVKQDHGRYPGRQGRIPDELWARKEWP